MPLPKPEDFKRDAPNPERGQHTPAGAVAHIIQVLESMEASDAKRVLRTACVYFSVDVD